MNILKARFCPGLLQSKIDHSHMASVLKVSFMKNKNLLCAYLLLSSFLFCNIVSAQVPVRDEPHHKVVLENDYVRLIDVHIPSHDTTLTHIHASASVIVFLSTTTIGAQIVGDKPVISDVSPGQTSYAAYAHETGPACALFGLPSTGSIDFNSFVPQEKLKRA